MRLKPKGPLWTIWNSEPWSHLLKNCWNQPYASQHIAFPVSLTESTVSEMFCGKKTDCRELKENGKKNKQCCGQAREGRQQDMRMAFELVGKIHWWGTVWEDGLCITENQEEEIRGTERFRMPRKERSKKEWRGLHLKKKRPFIFIRATVYFVPTRHFTAHL